MIQCKHSSDRLTLNVHVQTNSLSECSMNNAWLYVRMWIHTKLINHPNLVRVLFWDAEAEVSVCVCVVCICVCVNVFRYTILVVYPVCRGELDMLLY